MSINVATVDSPQWGELTATGRYSPGGYISASSATPANNRLYFMPFKVSTMVTLDQLAINHTATAAGASSVVRTGIYQAHATTRFPDALLVAAPTIALDSGAAFKTATINQVVYPGFYWLAAVAQITSGSPTTRVSAAPLYAVPAVADESNASLFQDTVTGALPATATPSALANVATQILVWMRRSA